LASGDLAGARTAANNALRFATAPDQPLIRLEAHRLLGKVATATKSHGAAEEHLATALGLAAECDVPFERALTLLALAELRLATKQSGEAEQLLNDVRGVCEPLGARPTLARVEALVAAGTSAERAAPEPFGLTPRELDVLRLVADGRSDREIAAALFVGSGTVRTHLTSIFGKLDVGSRTGAIAAARRLGIV
jgi:ATP/maltotriose-dependent transcriptional regulator MalT